MTRFPILLLLLCSSFQSIGQKLQQVYKDNKTLTYDQVIENYKLLAENNKEAKLIEYGKTDVGKPLHLFLISAEGTFNSEKKKENRSSMILINNGIHPGEPCGIDASVKFADQLLNGSIEMDEKTLIGIIPVYSTGGALNRNCCTRVNQNGPEMHGFRGNARNLDLNRDFIKCDSDNARAFTRLFRKWDPDIFIDTHSTNGADYQHVMTLIATQKDKLANPLSSFMTENMLPDLYQEMEARGYPMCPYVHTMGKTPRKGLKDYLETPRYSTGYTALYNTIGLVTETHMLKPYQERVESTYEFLEATLAFTQENHQKLKETRKAAKRRIAAQEELPLRWQLDTTHHDSFPFMGYEPTYRKSQVTGIKTLHYDTTAPYTKNIPYYNHYKITTKVAKPEAYIIPQAWSEVIDRLEWNGIPTHRLDSDTTLTVTSYYLRDEKTIDRPYEGHYMHRNVSIEKQEQERKFHQGAVWVSTGTAADRYIMETLEPKGMDSFFTWNFFDEVLMQKEYFSSYLFDSKAEKILEEKPAIRKAFEKKKQNDPDFADNKRTQLDFIYKRSKHYEDTHRRYPVGRIEN